MTEFEIGTVWANRAGEVVKVVEHDDGLGWVRVLRKNSPDRISRYNFWLQSGSRASPMATRDQLLSKDYDQPMEDDLMIQIDEDDYPEYFI